MKRSDEVKVGLFVLVGLFLLGLALVFVGRVNLFRTPVNTYTLYTGFAGGMERGAPVRYAGIRVGRIEDILIDSADATRAKIVISVDPAVPVRHDATAKVSTLGLLGEYYVEIHPKSADAELLASGGEIPVQEGVEWTELMNRVGDATVEAKALLADARTRLNVVLDNVKDLTREENRERVRTALKRVDEILADAQPRVKTILANFDNTSLKVDKFMDEIKVTRAKLDVLLDNWGHLAGEDDAEVEMTLRKLRDTLARAETTMDEVRRLLVANRENLDVTMENIRLSSEDIRELTDTLKQRPYSLIRVKNPPDRVPGEPEKKQ